MIGSSSIENFLQVFPTSKFVSLICIRLETNRQKHHCFRLQNDKSSLKSLWPISCRDFIFLPVFPVLKHELDDHFEIIKFVAKGSFGSVYQVKRKKDSLTFALKVFEKSRVS